MPEQTDLATTAAEEGPPAFPIVGVGASAGGLAPTVSLIRALDESPGVAVVVVHHLDPRHESGLCEILRRSSAMPVAAVTDGSAAEVNHVYVVPPNAAVLIEGGTLRLVPRVDEGGPHHPIDRFFESVAEDVGGRSIGVVLSGTGYDGTAGIKAIKSAGGIGIAQDASAEHLSMPQNAVATGCVDFVLPPEAIARELARIAAHPERLMPPSPRPAEEQDLVKILALVRKTCGVDFTHYKRSTIRRRVQRRLTLHGVDSLGEYLALLQREPSEIPALCDEALIHVTGFFREADAFEALTTTLLPRLCDHRPSELPLRIWVPGCSTGEEVYSIAISVLEYLEQAQRKELPVKIFGTDLSLATIARARSGIYPTSIESEVSPHRLQRYFSVQEVGYQIRPDVRDLCVFAKHDITRDPPFSSIDLISCRNVLIYLEPNLQDRVFGLLHYALNEPGFLVLGSAESVRPSAGFIAVEGKSKIFARTSSAPRPTFDFAPPSYAFDLSTSGRLPPVAPFFPQPGTSSSSEVYREADRIVLAEFGPPGVVITDDLSIVQFRGQTGNFLEPAPGAASLDLLRMTREELRLPLRRAVDRAKSTQRAARDEGLKLEVGQVSHTVTIEVRPFTVQTSRQRYFLVLFADLTAVPSSAEPDEDVAQTSDEAVLTETRLKEELASTRHYLESVIEDREATNEELKAANEEIVSSNEELRSTNEELQSAKEELQAANEELRTLNEEMVVRHAETTLLNDDLTNVLSSVEIPIVIVGRDAHMRRFTPAAAKLFGCLPTDVGRAVVEIQPLATVVPSLGRMMADVLTTLRPAECTAQDAGGRWYQITVRPYVTLDGRIDGTVITAQDVDAVKRGVARLAEARKYAEGIVDTVREGLVVLDRDLRVRSANKSFQRVFRVTPKDFEGQRLDDLGRPELASPELRQLIAGLGEGQTFEGFRAEGKDATGGARVFLLSARHIEGTPQVLLAIEDVTEIERAAAAVTQAEHGLRDILTHASEAIFMLDGAGTILFVNNSAATMFGYKAEELMGLPIETLVPETSRTAHGGLRADLTTPYPSRPTRPGRALIGLRKDGSTFPIEVIVSPASTTGGPRVVAFVTDVTSRRAAEASIQAYQDRLLRMAFDQATAEERERRRIAVELHDRIGQSLALAQIKLSGAREGISGPARAAMDDSIALLERSITETRSLTFDLSPPVLYDLGLKEALGWLAEEVARRQGMRVELVDDGAEKTLDDTTRALVFRAVREVLMNVFKHAGTSAAKVSLKRADDHYEIAVEDSGVGFDQEAVSTRAGGFGLLSVREQLRSLGGTLEIISAPSQGTCVKMGLPLPTNAVGRTS